MANKRVGSEKLGQDQTIDDRVTPESFFKSRNLLDFLRARALFKI